MFSSAARKNHLVVGAGRAGSATVRGVGAGAGLDVLAVDVADVFDVLAARFAAAASLLAF